MGNIKTDTFAVNHLAFLCHMITEDTPQGFVQQMGRRVIALCFFAIIDIDRKMRVITDFHCARERSNVSMQITRAFLNINNLNARAIIKGRDTLIASLTAAFRIERRFVRQENNVDRVETHMYRKA